MARQLTDEQKQKLWAGRAKYHAALQAAKAQTPKGAEARAIAAQGGDPEPTALEKFRKDRALKKRQKNGHAPAPVIQLPSHPTDFEAMTLEQLREWVTVAKKDWDRAMIVLRSKESVYATDHTSVPCACGCGTLIDLSRGRFASSEAYYDENRQIKVRYWFSQRCVQAYRLAQSPEYKDQVRKEVEDQLKQRATPTAPKILEA